MSRSDHELQGLSGHVLWHVRQFGRLGAHLAQRQKSGASVMVLPTDAAALEAFLLHARALTEFVWRSRTDKPAPWKTDGLAEDYFETGRWRPPPKPDRLAAMMQRVGWGVVHVSYRRLDPEEAWGWDFAWLGVALYTGLVAFARQVPAERVVDGFDEALRHEFVDRFGITLGHSVGTPILGWWLPRASS